MIGAAGHHRPATVRRQQGLDSVQRVMTAQGCAEGVLYLDDGHNPERTVGAARVKSPLSGGAGEKRCVAAVG